MRVAVACSGGADSVALLRALLERKNALGIVLSVAHVNHGLREEESESDEQFVASLAQKFGLPLHIERVTTRSQAAAQHQTVEEAARHSRYAFFRHLLAEGHADAVVTAHTLDDQAETVLHRLLRGAWTEGLAGIHPRLVESHGAVLRPFLAVRREEIEAWLKAIGQNWREDSSNRDPAFTRNRIRHELLPLLAGYNPQIAQQLARLAGIAGDEEAYWQTELTRLLPSLLLSGTAVRGGGRATSTLPGSASMSIEIERLRPLHPAVRRRIVRAAAARLGYSLSFDETERGLALCGFDGASRDSGKRLEFEGGLSITRTPRELRLAQTTLPQSQPASAVAEYTLSIPGTVDAPAFGIRVTASVDAPPPSPLPNALLRTPRPGDRVRLRHTRSPMKVKDALRRCAIRADSAQWPLLSWQGEIVWIQGVELEPDAAAGSAALRIISERLKDVDLPPENI